MALVTGLDTGTQAYFLHQRGSRQGARIPLSALILQLGQGEHIGSRYSAVPMLAKTVCAPTPTDTLAAQDNSERMNARREIIESLSCSSRPR